jgi:hypothetical protein
MVATIVRVVLLRMVLTLAEGAPVRFVDFARRVSRSERGAVL